MRYSRLMVVILVAAGMLVGCDDSGDGPEDPGFSVTLTVTDSGGQPVSGLHVATMPVVPVLFWAPPAGGDRTPIAVTCAFSLETVREVRVEVRDVTGAVQRVLADRELQPGRHGLGFDGRDDAAAPLPGSWYSFHLESSPVGGSPTPEVTDTPFILPICDPYWHELGTTDADGHLVLTDRIIVPAFWDPAPAGGITLTTETLVRLEDAAGAGVYTTFTAVDGPQTVAVIWAP